MRWEYQLMRDMLERANTYLGIYSPECQKTGSMLRQAARVMTDWDRKLVFMEIALRQIENLDVTQVEYCSEKMQNIARTVLREWGSKQSGECTAVV